MRLVVATGNENKLKEMQAILKNHTLLSLKDLKINCEIQETGNTFYQNAIIKAETVCSLTNLPTIADDSGLEVDFLNGAPGIYSARYAGENATDFERNEKLLKELSGVPLEKRTARFVCAIAIAYPNGEIHAFKGSCEGIIAFKPLGENGFGYDPLFFYPPFNKTLAQVDNEIKNTVSHRYNALKMLEDFLKTR